MFLQRVRRFKSASGSKSEVLHLVITPVRKIFSFPGSAWERTAFEALPRFVPCQPCAIPQAEPAMHWLPGEPGTSGWR